MMQSPLFQRCQPASAHSRRRFGHKVHKVGVSVAQTCPNRQGLGGLRACTICDPWGAAANEDTAGLPLRPAADAGATPWA